MFQAMELCHSGKRCSARPAVGSTLQHGEALYPVMLKASKGRTGHARGKSGTIETFLDPCHHLGYKFFGHHLCAMLQDSRCCCDYVVTVKSGEANTEPSSGRNVFSTRTPTVETQGLA